MIYTLAITKSYELKKDIPIQNLSAEDILWYWVDFDCPNEEEILLLSTFFNFHHLAIEDCLNFLQRPKIDCYENYDFFVVHILNQNNLKSDELDLFVSDNFIVSFHLSPVKEIEEMLNKLPFNEKALRNGSPYMAYLIIDKIVDNYFPAVYDIEDSINDLIENENNDSIKSIMDDLYDTRSKLLKLRRIVILMRDLMYKILTSSEFLNLKKQHRYFSDIYDHLFKLSEMIESSQEITSEVRQNHLSVNSYHMNQNMMLLTIISSIFIPLTFIVGVYGMNFKFMPELSWRYGYFICLAFMVIVTIAMLYWFKKRGWINFMYNKKDE